jgi:hypothetical protein
MVPFLLDDEKARSILDQDLTAHSIEEEVVRKASAIIRQENR